MTSDLIQDVFIAIDDHCSETGADIDSAEVTFTMGSGARHTATWEYVNVHGDYESFDMYADDGHVFFGAQAVESITVNYQQ